MPAQPVSFRLDDVRGRQPVVLIFAPSERSPAFQNQVTLLEEEEVARRTKCVLVLVLGEGTSSVDGDHLDAASADALRTSFGVGVDDFLVVLIGVDGTERHRDDTPLQSAAIEHRLSDGGRGD